MNYKQIRDDEFIRGKVPMTKSEIRTLSVIKMGITENDVVWDIGAGTGSISIEAALNYSKSKIYAIERNIEGINLIKENMKKFDVNNIIPVEGLAPEVFITVLLSVLPMAVMLNTKRFTASVTSVWPPITSTPSSAAVV